MPESGRRRGVACRMRRGANAPFPTSHEAHRTRRATTTTRAAEGAKQVTTTVAAREGGPRTFSNPQKLARIRDLTSNRLPELRPRRWKMLCRREFEGKSRAEEGTTELAEAWVLLSDDWGTQGSSQIALAVAGLQMPVGQRWLHAKVLFKNGERRAKVMAGRGGGRKLREGL